MADFDGQLYVGAVVRSQAESVAIVLQVKAKPRARTSELAQTPDGTWVAKLKSSPVDGKANAELIALVAARFKCPKAAVSIKSGATGRFKIVAIETS